jgi:hypothetical protein
LKRHQVRLKPEMLNSLLNVWPDNPDGETLYQPYSAQLGCDAFEMLINKIQIIFVHLSLSKRSEVVRST